MASNDTIIVVQDLEGGDINYNSVLSGDEVTSRDVRYSLVGETGSRIQLNISPTDYKMTAILKDKDGNTIYTSNVIDLPLESVVVNGSYDNVTKKVILTLQNGNTIEFSVADLVAGLVSDTDYATDSKAGVFKTSTNAANSVNGNGILVASIKTYANYSSGSDAMFISKGTLENVITGKGLVSNTDYATAATGGVIKSANKLKVSSAGVPYVEGLTYSNYEAADPNIFIGKTTLENVLTERIGDIESALVSI